MKFIAVAISALAGLAAATPHARGTTDLDAPSFNVDLSELAAILAEGDEGGLEKRDSCPHLQYCVGNRCVRLECFAIGRAGTTCITHKYGPC